MKLQSEIENHKRRSFSEIFLLHHAPSQVEYTIFSRYFGIWFEDHFQNPEWHENDWEKTNKQTNKKHNQKQLVKKEFVILFKTLENSSSVFPEFPFSILWPLLLFLRFIYRDGFNFICHRQQNDVG